MKKLMTYLGVLALCLGGCSTPQKETVTADPADSNYLTEKGNDEKIVVYQMMTRLFGNKVANNQKYGTKEENGVGKFNDINDAALQSLRALGVTHVWYTGVLEHAIMADYTHLGIPLDDADVIKGRAGSPYAIKDYYDVNPDLAEDPASRLQEFEALVQRTHEQGMKVIIDFVPNHVARFYQSDAKPEGVSDFGETDDTSVAFNANNNFYYLPGEALQIPEGYDPLGEANTFATEDGKFAENPAKATGNNVFSATPSINDWFETVKLNYGVDYQNGEKEYFQPVPDTWKKMLNILLYWAEKGVDGFRCDMAEMVPVAFWKWVIPQVKQKRPQIQFIAEIYNPARYGAYLDEGKFDFLYDKVQLYDSLKYIVQQKGSTHNLPQIWQSLRGYNRQMLRFLENHDEQRIASADFAQTPENALPAMVVTATLFTGPTMIYFGQEVGEPGLGDEGFGGEDGRTTIFDYWGVPKHQQWMNGGAFDGGQLDENAQQLRAFYGELLNFSTSNEAIAKGDLYDLQIANAQTEGYTDKVYSYLRFTDAQCLLVVTNFSRTESATFSLQIPPNALALAQKQLGNLNAQGVMGTSESIAVTEEGIPLQVPPLGSFIFELKNTP